MLPNFPPRNAASVADRMRARAANHDARAAEYEALALDAPTDASRDLAAEHRQLGGRWRKIRALLGARIGDR